MEQCVISEPFSSIFVSHWAKPHYIVFFVSDHTIFSTLFFEREIYIIINFFRFHTTEKPDGLVSLDEYISRMKDDQDTILYLSGDSKDSIMRSPILQKYTKRGYEVLILDDPIDEFTT